MSRAYKRYRDDIRNTFTIYALTPVILITLCSYILSFSLLYKTIAHRNETINIKVAQTIETIASDYSVKLNEMSSDAAVLNILKSQTATIEAYGELYDFVNQMELKANFFLFDHALHPIIASSNHIPQYASTKEALGWGILRRMQDSPEEVILSRQYSSATNRSTLSIGKAIVIEDNVVGFVIFDLEDKELLRLFGENFSTSTVITDSFGYVIAYTNEMLVNELGKIDTRFKDHSGVIKSRGDSHYVTKTEVMNDKLSIYTITTTGFFGSILLLVGILLLLIFGVLTVVTYLTARKIATKKTQVIDDIIRAIENVQSGDLQTRLKVHTNNEFEIFAESYNQMLINIKNLIEVNKEKALQTVLSEIKQLEAQFNPHFLFNTLETIRVMVKLDPVSADKIIIGLSELLRYSINSSVTEVRLREDITYTKNFLLIQKYRFGKSLNYEIDLDEETYDCIVPKLLVQPMIENAIKYGFAAKSVLKIAIKASFADGKLVVVISDDGVGMDTQVLQELREIFTKGVNHTSHIGLYNVHRRVQLMYGETYGLKISSRENQGTVIKIILPQIGDFHDAEGINC